MKQVFICEQCGKQFDDYDSAYACEHMHLREFHFEMDEELKKRWVFNPGEHAPKQIVLMEREEKWNEDEQKYEYTYHCFTYKYANTMPESETAKILEEHRLRCEEEERRFREWQVQWEAEKKAKAEQEANEKAETESA